MVILDDIILALGSYLIYEGATRAIVWGINKWRSSRLRKNAADYLVAPELSETDHETIERLREIMAEEFPEGIVERLQGLSVEDRQKLFKGIVLECETVYNIKLPDIRFLRNSEIGAGTLGYFSMNDGSINFNVDCIASDDPEVLRMMVNTIFHECRHAYQWRATHDSSVDLGTEEQRRLWALNFVNYIPAEVDFALYQEQVVEADARLFADAVVTGY